MSSSKGIISINQNSLIFKINKTTLQSLQSLPENSLIPISETVITITNITSNYVAYRARINNRKYYTVEPTHSIIKPNSNINVKITFYFSPSLKFPPEGNKFRFDAVIIQDKFSERDPKKIFEEFESNKNEVKEESIKKICEFIYDNSYNYVSQDEDEIKLIKNLENSNKNLNIEESIYTNALGKSNENSQIYTFRKTNLKSSKKKVTIREESSQLKMECEKLNNDYEKYLKEFNGIKNKISNLSSTNKYKYKIPNTEVSNINRKKIITLFCIFFLLGFYLTK